MSATYRLVRNPNPNKDGKIQPLHARFVPAGTVSLDDIIKDAQSRSSFSPADIKGMLQLFHELLSDYLMFGYQVELEGIGTFGVSLECRPVMDPKEIRAESVHFRTVNYRPAQKLLKRLRAMPVSRSEKKERRPLPQAEGKERVFDYLNRSGYITVTDYMHLIGCSRPMANRQLREYIRQGLLIRRGRGPCTFYVGGER